MGQGHDAIMSVISSVGLWELANLLCLRNINKEGMAMLGMKYDKNVWKKTLLTRIHEYGRREWRNGFGINEREQQYVHMKSQPNMINMQMTVWERE